jgi:hypothetical protein
LQTFFLCKIRKSLRCCFDLRNILPYAAYFVLSTIGEILLSLQNKKISPIVERTIAVPCSD